MIAPNTTSLMGHQQFYKSHYRHKSKELNKEQSLSQQQAMPSNKSVLYLQQLSLKLIHS
jgi:hypothetical protein